MAYIFIHRWMWYLCSVKWHLWLISFPGQVKKKSGKKSINLPFWLTCSLGASDVNFEVQQAAHQKIMQKRRRSILKPQSALSTQPERRRQQARPLGLPLLSINLQPLNGRADAVGLLLLFISAFALFAVSAARTIVLEDDGLFVSAAWFAGVVHPPGYPLYTMLGWLSSHLLPFGEIPWRVHIVSGFMGAITCVCIAWLVLRRAGNRPAAYLAGAALAVSEHFWSQSIIADVYTTNTALLFLCLVLVQEAAVKRHTSLWMGAAFFYGLGLANHWPLLILGSPIFVAYALASGKELWGKLHYLALAALLPAILLYVWLAWRSHQAPLINFLGPINSPSEMIAFIRRDIFSNADSQVTAGFIDKLYYARYFISEGLLQFSLLGGILAFYGLLHSWHSGWRSGCYGEIAALLSSSLLLIGLLGFEYEYIRIAVFRPYPLVAYCIVAFWFGLGIDALMQFATQRASRWRKRLPPIIYASFGLVILALGINNGYTNYRANDRFAEQYAQSLFDGVEQHAVLVPHGDAHVFSTTYYHLVEGKRPDIRLLEPNGFLLNDRVIQPLWSKYRKSAKWQEFASNIDQPFYYQSLNDILANQVGQRVIGFVNKLDNSVPPAKIRFATNDAAKIFFKKMLLLPDTRDRWTMFQRNVAIQTYGRYLGQVIGVDDATLNDHIKDVLPLAENNYWSLVGMSTALLDQSPKYVATAEKYINKAKRLADEQRSKKNLGELLYLQGRVAQKKGDASKAVALFKESLKINPAKGNPARKKLNKLNKQGLP